MAQFTLSYAAGQNCLTSILTDMNAGSTVANPYIELRTGSKPARPDATATGTLLGTLTCASGTGAVSLVGGTTPTLTFGTITPDASADATGTAGWARFYNRDNVAVFDIDVTNTGGGGFGTMNTTSVTIGGPITAPSVAITL